jgi:hypothetical protein
MKTFQEIVNYRRSIRHYKDAPIDAEKVKIRQNMPLKVTIERDMNEDIELLHLVEIVNKNGDSVKNSFSLQVQSMSEVENFWLDSGIFSLNINNSKN